MIRWLTGQRVSDKNADICEKVRKLNNSLIKNLTRSLT